MSGLPGAAIVLGARNLGAALTSDLLARGVRVATIARTQSDLEPLARQGAVTISADASDPDALTAALDQAAAEIGHPELIVNAVAPTRPPTDRSGFGGGAMASASLEGFETWTLPVARQTLVFLGSAARAGGPARHRDSGHRRPCEADQPRARARLRRHDRRPRVHARGRARAPRVRHPRCAPDRRRHHRVTEDNRDGEGPTALSARPPRGHRSRSAVPRRANTPRNDARTPPHARGRQVGPVTRPARRPGVMTSDLPDAPAGTLREGVKSSPLISLRHLRKDRTDIRARFLLIPLAVTALVAGSLGMVDPTRSGATALVAVPASPHGLASGPWRRAGQPRASPRNVDAAAELRAGGCGTAWTGHAARRGVRVPLGASGTARSRSVGGSCDGTRGDWSGRT